VAILLGGSLGAGMPHGAERGPLKGMERTCVRCSGLLWLRLFGHCKGGAGSAKKGTAALRRWTRLSELLCDSFTVLWGRISISVFTTNSWTSTEKGTFTVNTPAGSMFHVKKNSSCSRFKNWLFKNPIVRRAPSHGTVHFGPKQRPRNQNSRKFRGTCRESSQAESRARERDVSDG
jgi:hypothetical protein